MALIAGISLAIAGCSAPEEDAASETAETADASPTPSASPAPEVFATTAWRIVAEDGARYTTMIDADGTYRDLRNGDPWQTGSWTWDADGASRLLCFTPEDENSVERCWKPDDMRGDTMEVVDDTGRRIELTRVDYELPETDEPAA